MEKAIKAYAELVEKRYNDYMTHSFPSLKKEYVKMTLGRKYTKILIGEFPEDDNGGVHSFINNKTGDIHKPNSWRAPHPKARGNVNSETKGTESFGSQTLERSGNSYYWIKYLNGM